MSANSCGWPIWSENFFGDDLGCIVSHTVMWYQYDKSKAKNLIFCKIFYVFFTFTFKLHWRKWSKKIIFFGCGFYFKKYNFLSINCQNCNLFATEKSFFTHGTFLCVMLAYVDVLTRVVESLFFQSKSRFHLVFAQNVIPLGEFWRVWFCFF